jgi:hypothetical protein
MATERAKKVDQNKWLCSCGEVFVLPDWWGATKDTLVHIACPRCWKRWCSTCGEPRGYCGHYQ